METTVVSNSLIDVLLKEFKSKRKKEEKDKNIIYIFDKKSNNKILVKG